MAASDIRKIPYNYTSADDSQIVRLLIGDSGYRRLQKSRLLKSSGPALHPLMRFFGDMFMLRRNPFVRNELIASPRRHRQFFSAAALDLEMVAGAVIDHAGGHSDGSAVLEDCRHCLEATDAGIRQIADRQRRVHKRLAPLIGKANIFTDPFTLNAHVTDATNWRLHLPLAVVRPTREAQVPELIRILGADGFKVIPRGGGHRTDGRQRAVG